MEERGDEELETTEPTVAATEPFDSDSAPAKNRKPTAARSVPVRFAGRRHVPRSPAVVNESPISSPKIACDRRLRLVVARQHERHRQPRRGERRGPVEEAEPRPAAHSIRAAIAAPDSSAFAMKPRAPGFGDQRPEVARLAARGQHDLRHRVEPGRPRRDFEAVDVRELDVEQHDLGREPPDRRQRRLAVRRFADDDEALRLEQRTCGGAEGGVVVDDEDRPHLPMLAEREHRHGTGSRTAGLAEGAGEAGRHRSAGRLIRIAAPATIATTAPARASKKKWLPVATITKRTNSG